MHESGEIPVKLNGFLQELYLSMKHSPIIFAGPDDSSALSNTLSARRGKCMDGKDTLECKDKKKRGDGGAVNGNGRSIFMQPVILVRSLGPYDFKVMMGKWGS